MWGRVEIHFYHKNGTNIKVHRARIYTIITLDLVTFKRKSFCFLEKSVMRKARFIKGGQRGVILPLIIKFIIIVQTNLSEFLQLIIIK